MSARSKLAEAREAAMRFSDSKRAPSERRRDFMAAVAACRTAYERVEHDALSRWHGASDAKRGKAATRSWWSRMHKRATADELMRWVFDARNDDHHIPRGQDPLVYRGSMSLSAKMESPGVQVMDWTGEIFDVINAGTDEEYRVPRGSANITNSTMHWALSNPPHTHLGRPVPDLTARELLDHAIDYVTDLLRRSRGGIDELEADA